MRWEREGKGSGGKEGDGSFDSPACAFAVRLVLMSVGFSSFCSPSRDVLLQRWVRGWWNGIGRNGGGEWDGGRLGG